MLKSCKAYRMVGGSGLLQVGHQPFLLEVIGACHIHVRLLPGEILVDATAAQLTMRIPVLRHELLARQMTEDGHALGQLIAVIGDRGQLAEPIDFVPKLARQVLTL